MMGHLMLEAELWRPLPERPDRNFDRPPWLADRIGALLRRVRAICAV